MCLFCFVVQATSALDTITENSIQVALNALGQDRTVLIIAHRLSTIRHAHQIIVMDGGRVAECGTHDELVANPDSHYAKMWQMQVNGATGVGLGHVTSADDFSVLDNESETPSLLSSKSSNNDSQKAHGKKKVHG